MVKILNSRDRYGSRGDFFSKYTAMSKWAEMKMDERRNFKKEKKKEIPL